MTKRPSMADVAALAGVSAQTVSRVVNASPRVDPATRARVEAAMETSGYRVHRAARALRTGRSGTIGAIVSTLSTVGNSLMLEAVVAEAAARGHDVAIAMIGAGTTPAEAFDRLRAQGVDGVVVVNEASALARSAELPADLHFAVVDSPPDDRYAGVETDHAAGAAAATRHLLDLGHATVAHIAGPADSYAAAERERGWRDELARAGAPEGPIVRGRWTSASGYDAAAALLGRSAGTAMFVANDQMSLGVLRALGDRGLRVPDDVSVIGFDDVADAANYPPPLTTVRQHFDRLGALAVAALLDGGAPGRRAIVPATLIARASTAPPPA